MMKYHRTKCCCKRISSSNEIAESHHYFDYMSLHYVLVMTRQHIKLGNKRVSDSEDIVRTNIY